MPRVVLPVVLLLVASAAAAAPQKKLAVLEFEVAKGLEIDRRTFSARVQNAARRSAPDLFVMTQANIETLVRAAGKTLEQCEGQCAVDTGRLIGADIVIGGRISRIGKTFAISMQMYETASGELTGGEDVSAKTEDELLAALEAAAGKLVASLGAGPARAVEPPPAATGGPAPARAQQGVLKIVSTPAGAKVSIDGDPAGATPLTVKRDAGSYVVSIELAGFAPVSKQVDVEAGKAAVLNETLLQAAGYLEIAVSPDAAARAASIAIDGNAAGPGKQGPFKVGTHTVRAEAQGYKPAEAKFSVDSGGTTPARLALEPLPARLLISVNVSASCSAGDASVRAGPDSVARLEAAAGKVRVTCRAEGYDDAIADTEALPGKAQALKLALKRAEVRRSAAGAGPDGLVSFIAIPGGSFQFQGRTRTAVAAFRMGATDVTVEAFKACVDAGACTVPAPGCNLDNGRLDHPVNCVTYHQAEKFCAWIGARLPTDEEWEYVAAGGSENRTYPWGNEPPGARACWDGEGNDLGKGNRSGTCSVGAFPSGDSKWGVHDLSGNVLQWTSSNFTSALKSIRGGSYLDGKSDDLTARFQNGREPDKNFGYVGFRCAR